MAYEKDGVWYFDGTETDEELEEINRKVADPERFEKGREAREELMAKVLAEIELEQDDPAIH